MNFETYNASGNNENNLEKQQDKVLPFPLGDAAVNAYLEKHEDKPEQAEILRAVFQEFISEELANTKLFRSAESGLEMPYTSINIGTLARRIHQKLCSSELPAEEKPALPEKQKYIFATSPALEDGDQFTSVEAAMHDCVKKLPAALEELRKGDLSEDEEIITVGMPTNVLGKIPPELVEKISKSPFDELSKAYAEFIAGKIKDGGDKLKNVELLGMSLGASLAVRTGEDLMDKNIVAQGEDKQETTEEPEKTAIPHLQIRADVPVALGPSKLKPIQIPAGFIADGLWELRRPDVKTNLAGRKNFMETTRAILAERGIKEQMSDEQKKAKNKVMRSIIFGLGKGLKPRPGTKVTEVYGLRDLTSVTPGMLQEARTQKEEHGGTLGENLLSRERTDERRFGVKMTHLNPWFRENEVKRMDALVGKLEELKNS